MPMTLDPGISTLELRQNDFHSVDASLNFYPELLLLDLSDNEIVTIPDRAFISQRRLVELKISDNKISELTSATFSGLMNLKVLYLNSNFIEEIPQHSFRHLSE